MVYCPGLYSCDAMCHVSGSIVHLVEITMNNIIILISETLKQIFEGH